MADSNTQIANLALSMIGTRSTIASLTEASAEARQCNLHYLPALDACLQAAFWNFARKQAPLTLLQDATVTAGSVPTPWLYEYAYPGDCIQARYVIPTLDNMPASAPGVQSIPLYMGAPVRFLISTDTDASGNDIKVILTNQPSAQLVYTKRITNVSLFDEQFTMTLAAYLGSRICLALTGDKAMAKMAFEVADKTSRTAQASNGNEGLTVIDNVPDWVRVRGYSSDWAYPPGSFMASPQNLTMVS